MIATSLVCLALTIFVESNNEPEKGKIAVASVVMNRVDKNGSTICDEITKPGQFPWAKHKIQKVHHGYTISEKVLPKGTAWETSLKIASEVISGDTKVIPRITSFHNSKESPRWKLRFAYKIGNHLFYYS